MPHKLSDLHDDIINSIQKIFYDTCTKYYYLSNLDITHEERIKTNTKDFCLRKSITFLKLFRKFIVQGSLSDYDKRKLKKIGEKFLQSGTPVAVFIDAFNVFSSKISSFLIEEKIPLIYLKKFKLFQSEVLNSIADGFITASLRNRNEYGKLLPPETRDLFFTFLTLFKKPIKKKNHREIFNNIEKKLNTLFIKVLTFKDNEFNVYKLLDSIKKQFLLFRKFYGEKTLSAYMVYEQAIDTAEKIINIYSAWTAQKKNIELTLILEYILAHPERKWRLILFDPSEITLINKLCGFSVGDAIFNKLIEVVSKYFHEDEKTAIFKCKGGVVFVLTEKEINFDISKLKLNVEHYIKYRQIKLDISVAITDIIIPKESTKNFSLNEFEELISYLSKVLLKKEKRKYLKIDISNKTLHEKIINSLQFRNYIIEMIEENKISLAVQPIVNLKSGQVEHYEILFRIADKNGRYIPAYEIIDILYELRLVHKLDLAVLKKLAENILLLKKKNINSFFINISPNTLKTKKNFFTVKNLLLKIASHVKIGIEITEQALLENHDILKSLFKNTKIPVSIDDFGAGYSSFSRLLEMLEELPLTFLKIDGSYVKKILESRKSKVMVKTINIMAHSLNLKTIAEFVETQELTETLKKMNIDYGQGYYFGKPKIIIP